MSSLYDRIGGHKTVKACVDIFYKKVLADDRIKHFFTDIDMILQRGHQRRFLTFAFGGAPHYDGATMRDAHLKLVKDKGLNDEHYDAIDEHLVSTLQEIGIDAPLIQEAEERIESLRDDVLNR